MKEYKEMKIGDLITAYHKGIHRLLRIEKRDCSPLFYYEGVLNSKGKKSPRKERSCDSAFCRPAQLHIDKKKAELDNIIANYDKALRGEL